MIINIGNKEFTYNGLEVCIDKHNDIFEVAFKGIIDNIYSAVVLLLSEDDLEKFIKYITSNYKKIKKLLLEEDDFNIIYVN